MAMAQLNLRVGDLVENKQKILDAYKTAVDNAADVAVFSELTITGYPPEDLLLKPKFVEEAYKCVKLLALETTRTLAVVGFPEFNDGDLYNAAALCAHGEILGIYRKQFLPNYSVFDEARYFKASQASSDLYEVNGVLLSLSICEDLWVDGELNFSVIPDGAELGISLNSSPYDYRKQKNRERVVSSRAVESEIPLVYVNQVGGQDDLIFDGSSFVIDGKGNTICRLQKFVEEVALIDIEITEQNDRDTLINRTIISSEVQRTQVIEQPKLLQALDRSSEVWSALVIATRDYVQKNGFTDVVVGLSGGIDSSLLAAIAVDAIGSDRVHGVSMPSRYSSEGSCTDALELANNLGISYQTIPIEPTHQAFLESLTPAFGVKEPDITEENLQSRIRGVLMMALSNKFGWLVLTTGNKSETAVGYSTLYGDTAGGFAVIKDCPKLLVYELCEWRNNESGIPWIPVTSITKPPSAELRPDQTDEQSLPSYEILDPLLEAYIEDDLTASQLVAEGYDSELVVRITRLVDLAEYKRRQSPPGPRITPKAFGKDRRLPITNLYR